MAIGGSGKGIQIVVGTDYNDRDLKRAQRDLDRLKGQAAKTAGPMARLGNTLRGSLGPSLALAGAAAGAFALRLGVDAVKAAAEEEQAVARLATALKNAGQSLALEPLEDGIDRMARSTGVADDQLRPAMITLVNATQDAAQAQGLLSLALDISAGSGRDLSSVTMALAKAANGQVTALRRLGVPLSDAAVKSKDLNTITAELQQTFRGQASASANTFKGRMQRLNVAVGELQESLGKGLIEGLEGGRDGTDSMGDAIKDLEPIVSGLGYQVGSVIGEIGQFTQVVLLGAEAVGILDAASQDAADSGLVGLTNSINGVFMALNPLRPLVELIGGIEVKESVASSHDDYRDAVQRASDAARDSVTSIGDMGQAVTESGDDAEDAAEKFDLFAAAIGKTDQVVAFRQALDKVSEAFKRGQEPVNIYGEKGQENFESLKGLIERTASYAETVDNVASQASIASQGLDGLSGALANAKMDSGTRALLLEPFQALINDLAEAGVDVTNLQLKLDALKSKTITVTTEYRFTGPNKEDLYQADGGPVAGMGLGVPRGSDTVPAMLTPGEFVIRRQAVNKFGADLFSQLNRGINPLAGMSVGGSGRAAGLTIGTINVTSVAGERADTSLPRALRRMAYLAGM